MKTLDFETTAELIAQMQNPTRQRVGGMEVVSGPVVSDDDAAHVTLCVDAMTGGNVVVEG